MRVLITIPHFWGNDKHKIYGSRRQPQGRRQAALQACLSSLTQLSNGSNTANLQSPSHEVANALVRNQLDVILCVTQACHVLQGIDLPADVSVKQCECNPMHLGFECHNVLRDNLNDEYDYYGYMEDDLLIHDPWWFPKLSWFRSIADDQSVLQANRFEIGDTSTWLKLYIDGEIPLEKTTDYQDITKAPEISGHFLGHEILFQRPTNPHAGCFFLSREQLECWCGQSDFGIPVESFYSALEGAATVGIMKHFRVYKPAASNRAFLELQHFGADWIHKIAARDAGWCNQSDTARKSSSKTVATTAASEDGYQRSHGWAIDFQTDAFVSSQEQAFGRRVAGREFLSAVIRHSSSPNLYCLTSSSDAFCKFAQWVNQKADNTKTATWVRHEAIRALRQAGTLYHASVSIAGPAWARRRIDQRSYSILGVTHTICSQAAVKSICELCTAPVQSWDALICTTNTARKAVQTMLDSWSHYLGDRLGYSRASRTNQPTATYSRAELPVIPLGVDVARYAKLRESADTRRRARKAWNIGHDEIVFLYVGRLSAHAKANPVVMFRALQAVAHRTKKKIRLVLFGWFASPELKVAFRSACKQFCPDIVVAHPDGSKQENVDIAWQVADVFIMLADNLQETFGLAPVEAMAAGLPLVVSDWDGFKDTVRDGVDGFRIATTMPSSHGENLVHRYQDGLASYDHYVAMTSQLVSIDDRELVEKCSRLVKNADLRRSMGEAAQNRARSTYDWPHIISAYEDLMAELADRRRVDDEITRGSESSSANPMLADPFQVFRGYPTRTIEPTTRLTLGDTRRLHLAGLMSGALTAAGINGILPSERDLVRVIDSLDSKHARSIENLLWTDLGHLTETQLYQSIAWLMKVGLVRTTDADARSHVMEDDVGRQIHGRATVQ